MATGIHTIPKSSLNLPLQSVFYCHTCKNHARLWLMYAKVFEKESKTNNDIILFSCIIFLNFLYFN